MRKIENQEFIEMVHQAKKEYRGQEDFPRVDWQWVNDLDDEGFFIFCYLIDDYNAQILTKDQFEQTVYTLVMLRHKFVPATLCEKMGLSYREQFQILFNLYEQLKNEEMSWDHCQEYINEQLQQYQSLVTTNN
ncbi:hypothetical protein WDW89_21945 [Deltaproteobacteria bacterium TL4]